MAGYVFTLNSLDALKEIVKNGVYSTYVKIPSGNHWSANHEGTFADYLSMKEGDNVYFFHKRKIYGVGKLIEVGDECIHLNFPDAHTPQPNDDLVNEYEDKVILDDEDSWLNHRFLCTFEGGPFLFKKGVDMDEILKSNPSAFRMLRAFWKLSFIKIDDDENKALFDKILKENEDYINAPTDEHIFEFDASIHDKILRLRQHYPSQYDATSKHILNLAKSGTKIKHEMAIEAAIIDSITKNHANNIFGSWDYISHQVVASPFKPIDYMDKMDIFGFKYIYGYKTKSKFLMIEIKKDAADVSVISQSMKYVDWVEQEYCHDYSMIEAYIVASDFPQEVIKARDEAAKRYFTKGRPGLNVEWKSLRLIKYQFDGESGNLNFTEVLN